MKNLLLVSIFIISAANTFAQEEPYEEAAQRMCDCVNNSMTMLSERMVNVFVVSNGDEALMEAEMEKYAEEDMEGMLKDVEVLSGPMLDDMSACFDRVGNDYEEIYTDDSDEEVETKLIGAMESLEGCETSVAFFRLGISSSTEEETETMASPPIVEDEIDEYLFMADDLCMCVNEATIPMSERMVAILADSEGDAAIVKEMMNEYASQDEAETRKDSQLMGEIDTDIEKCLARTESDYNDLFEQESEEMIQEKLLYHLENIDGCEVSYGVMNLYFSLEE